MMKDKIKATLKNTVQIAHELKEALEELKEEFTLEHDIDVKTIEDSFSALIKDDFEKCVGFYEWNRSKYKTDEQAIKKAVEHVSNEIRKDLLELYDIVEHEDGFLYDDNWRKELEYISRQSFLD